MGNAMRTPSHAQPTAHQDADIDTSPSARAVFDKVASDPVPIPQAGIDRAVEIMRSARVFRYGEDTSEPSEVAQLEAEFAKYIGRTYAVAANSCGCTLFLALKALGVRPGDEVLCNTFTLAPVPGAIVHAGAKPVYVDIDEALTLDIDSLEIQIERSDAKIMLLSHMRGHFNDISKIAAICKRNGVRLVEDCAHTLGASWGDRFVGTYGDVACFSSQTFKHVNSGEGGLLITDDDEVAARAIIMSGSYMMYEQNGTCPPAEVFERIRDSVPNFSMRMSNVAAAMLRPQLRELPSWVDAWNERYRWIESRLSSIPHIQTIARAADEHYVGSSIQFLVEGLSHHQTERFVDVAKQHGVFLKWFGAVRTAGFTSRYDQWQYAPSVAALPKSDAILTNLMDMRVALSLTEADCAVIAQVIAEAVDDVI